MFASCDFCKKDINIKPSRLKKSKHHFCSRDCRNKWLRENAPRGNNHHNWKEKVTVYCMFCSKEIKKHRAWAKKSEKHFCNKECYANWRRNSAIRAENHPRWNSILISCDFCNKQFYISKYQTKDKHHFCCKHCYFKWLKQNGRPSGKNNPLWSRTQINCDYCGKKIDVAPSRIKGRKHLFCSIKCHNAWQRKNTPIGTDNRRWNRLETKCAFCSKKLQRIPSRLEKYTNQFCNMDCMAKWQKQRNLGDKNPRWNSKAISCDYCGKGIFVRKSKLDRGKHHFCNANCHFKWLRKNLPMGKNNPNWNSIETNCDFCGEKKYVTSYRFKTFKNHFCNKSCFDKWSKINKPRGRNSPTWKGGSVPFYGTCWSSQKRKILERAKYASEISGNNGGLLDVHHIIPMRNFIQKYIDLCLGTIPSITLSSFKVLPYYLLIPDAIFEEANKESNLMCVTRNEHPGIEGMPPTFFEAILKKLNNT